MGLLSTIGAASGRAFGFTRSAIAAATDAFFNRVTLLLPGNGTNGAQNNTFLDSSTNNFTITRNGNTTQGTFSPFSQSGWGNYFNGSSYLNVGTTRFLDVSAWTVEMWVNTTSTANFVTLAAQYVASGGGFAQRTVLGINSSSGTVSIFQGGTAQNGTTNVADGRWHHIAFVLNAGTVRAYVDGINEATFSGFGSPTAVTTTFFYDSVNASSYFLGYASNLRVTNTAVYTANFTVATSQLTAITGTQLLTCQSNRFIDNSSNAFAITVNGTPSVQPFSPFAPTAAYSAATNGGSGYFDGTGDFLTTPSNAAFNLGTGDFTLECWVYATSTPSDVGIYEGRSNGNAGTVDGFTLGAFSGSVIRVFSNSVLISSSGTSYVGSWCHVAVTRVSGTFNLYINGVSQGTSATARTLSNTDAVIGAGRYTTTSTPSAFFPGYISGFRIIKGQALTTGNFTPPTAPVTGTAVGWTGANVASSITGTVSLLCSFTNAGITDATGKSVIETVGTAQISTAQSKWGGSSILFDGAATPEDKLVIPISALQLIGTSDFTFECWVRPQNVSTLQTLITYGSGAFRIFINSTNIWFLNGAGSIINANGSFTANNWFHVAVARKGSTGNNTACWVNGTRIATPVANTSDFNSGTTIQIGGEGTSNLLQGYLQDVRLTKFARYDPASSTITVPTAAFPLS